MRGQRFAVEIPPMPVMVEVGPGRGRGYVQILDTPGSIVIGRGGRFTPPPSDKFHTIPDREAGWQMVQKAMGDLLHDLDAAKAKDSKNTVVRMFWDAPVIGAGARLAQWGKFAADQELGRKNDYTGDGSVNPITNPDATPWALQYAQAARGVGPWDAAWNAYGDWLQHVADLRELARAAGVGVHSPEPPKPADLPSTLKVTEIPGAIIDKARGAVDRLGDLGKYALIGAAALAGTLIVVEVAKS
jgi:hypothetical protein